MCFPSVSTGISGAIAGSGRVEAKVLAPQLRVFLSLARLVHSDGFTFRHDKDGYPFRLRQVDIAKETGLSVKNVHRAILQFEAAGLVRRVGSHKGETQIFVNFSISSPKKAN